MERVLGKVDYTALQDQQSNEHPPVPSYEEAMTSHGSNVLHYSDPPAANIDYNQEIRSDTESVTTVSSFHDHEQQFFDIPVDYSDTEAILPRDHTTPQRSANRQNYIPSQQSVVTTQPIMVQQQTNRSIIIQPGRTDPSQDNLPYMNYFGNGDRPWSTGICNCCMDCRICCCSCFCFTCYSGALAMKMGEDCSVGCCLPAIGNLRTKFRLKHSIQGSVCDDACMVPCCCASCVVCQMGREMELLGYERKCGCC